MANRKSNNAALALLIGFFIVALGVILYIFPPWQVADDAAPKTDAGSMAALPVALWWLGSFLLAAAIIYAVMNNRRRSAAERMRSEQETKRVYDEEQRDARRQGLG